MSFSYSEATPGTVDSSYRALSSCDKPAHLHSWPISGELEIERCEHYCLYCRGPKALKKWSSAWFLRRHVRETHAKTEFPGLTVSEGWSKCPNGNARPLYKKQRAPGSNKKRIGTKKERAAMNKVLGRHNNDFGMSAASFATPDFGQPAYASPEMLQGQSTTFPFTTQAPTMSAPTAIMPGSTAEQAWSQLNDQMSYAPTSPAPLTSIASDSDAGFDFNSWHSNITAPSQLQLDNVAPEKLEPFPELGNVTAMDCNSSFETDLFDFDGYSDTIDPCLVDGAIGTSVPSAADKSEDLFAEHSDSSSSQTTLSNSELELANQLMAALHKPVNTNANDNMDSVDSCQNEAEFNDLFFGTQFSDWTTGESSFDDFASDPVFDDLLALKD